MCSVSEASQLEIDMMRRNSSPQICPLKSKHDGSELCRVCGDTSAKMHYGVLTCFGCKGFFRRALKRPTEYQCRHNGHCVVDKHERNSCRFCRFKKCLEVGMDPKAVRPDRDATGRHQGRARRSKLSTEDEGEIDSEWTRKLPVDMRTTLMQLMNVDLMVNSGDGATEGKSIYPLQINSLRQLLEDPSVLDGKRTEMRYEAYRQVEGIELPAIAHRRMLAIVDWVDHLFDMMDLHNSDDKMTLVKYGFAPLMVFCFSTATATSTKQRDVLCQCNYGYAPKATAQTYEDSYHLGNRVVPRTLDELVEPFRHLNLKEEECVLLKAIILLNPHLKPLTLEASETIADLRDRIHETLYHVVRETHPKEVASSRFGNLLLFVPSVNMIGSMVVENLQFVDSIMHAMADPLMRDFLTLHDEESDTRGLGAEQVLSPAPFEPRMNHSESSSSIESLISHSSQASSSGSYDSQQNGMTYNYSSSSLPGMAGTSGDSPLNSATSLPNLDQMNGQGETDPDYNLTLTPDMFTGIRQAMSVANNMDRNGMEVDRVATPPNSPDRMMAGERPQFFISTVESTKHKFTVTTSFDRYTNYAQQNQPPPMQQTQPNLYLQNGNSQTPLVRTNSLPPHQQFPQMAPYPNQQQAVYVNQGMDYEDGNYYQ